MPRAIIETDNNGLVTDMEVVDDTMIIKLPLQETKIIFQPNPELPGNEGIMKSTSIVRTDTDANSFALVPQDTQLVRGEYFKLEHSRGTSHVLHYDVGTRTEKKLRGILAVTDRNRRKLQQGIHPIRITMFDPEKFSDHAETEVESISTERRIQIVIDLKVRIAEALRTYSPNPTKKTLHLISQHI